MKFKQFFQTLYKENHTDQDHPPPIKPGKYFLWRGSDDDNENSSKGIYAHGIHYTTDITTAKEFGEKQRVHNVHLKNPFVSDSIGQTAQPLKRTQQLKNKGYDSLVIIHKKPYIRYYRDPEYPQELIEIDDFYNEYEVIKFVD